MTEVWKGSAAKQSGVVILELGKSCPWLDTPPVRQRRGLQPHKGAPSPGKRASVVAYNTGRREMCLVWLGSASITDLSLSEQRGLIIACAAGCAATAEADTGCRYRLSILTVGEQIQWRTFDDLTCVGPSAFTVGQRDSQWDLTKDVKVKR